MSDDEIYRRALELIRSVNTGATGHALEDFDKKIGTGHASSDLQQISEAAASGRVEHLFLPENMAVADADPLDMIVGQSLRHGGDVTVLPEHRMPGGLPICAVFRYTAVSPGRQ